jgi:hypothetical protein
MWQVTNLKNSRFHRFLKAVPVIGPVFRFGPIQHREALIKVSFLWAFSFLPILFAAGMANVPEGTEEILVFFGAALGDHFKAQSQFVYAATFIPPFLYIIFDQITEREGSIKEKVSRSIKGIFKGYKILFVISLLTLLLMAGTFGASQNSEASFSKTIFYAVISKNSLWFYLASMYIWYLSFLEETVRADGTFVERVRQGEDMMRNELQTRIENRLPKG